MKISTAAIALLGLPVALAGTFGPSVVEVHKHAQSGPRYVQLRLQQLTHRKQQSYRPTTMPTPPVLSLLTDYLTQARSLQPSEPSTSKKASKKSQTPSQKQPASSDKKSSATGGTKSSDERLSRSRTQ